MSYGAPNLPADKHFFFDRHGGVSAGKYASLNGSIKSDDDRENVLKNFALAAAHYHLPFERLAIVRQGTTNHAVFISQPERWQQFADGMVTDIPGIILTLRTADCCPVLFYDARNRIIGAAHAGWRGALYGIIENTLQLMLEHGAEKANIARPSAPACSSSPLNAAPICGTNFSGRTPPSNSFSFPPPTTAASGLIWRPLSSDGCKISALRIFPLRQSTPTAAKTISATAATPTAAC